MSNGKAKALQHRRNLDSAILILNALKTSQGCVDCGYNAHPAALHFDHTDPATKTRELGWFDDRSKLVTPNRLQNYLHHVTTYCQIRCANCHAVRTMTERHWQPNEQRRRAAAQDTLF